MKRLMTKIRLQNAGGNHLILCSLIVPKAAIRTSGSSGRYGVANFSIFGALFILLLALRSISLDGNRCRQAAWTGPDGSSGRRSACYQSLPGCF
jgi:hypothetical protein